jgi:hypothetical protein
MDAHGVTVVPAGGGWMCIAVLRRLVLAPRERYTRTFVWETSPFAPGNYSVYATFAAVEVKLVTSPVLIRVNE